MSDNIIIIDNFYQESTYQKLYSELLEHPFKYFHGDQHGSPYWNHRIVTKGERVDNTSPVGDLCTELWQEFRTKFLNHGLCQESYINLQTHGLEPGPHYDYFYHDGVTVINYIGKDWDLTWGGETLVYDNYAHSEFELKNVDRLLYDKISVDATVIPAYNRVCMFPSNQLHMVKPLSRFYSGVRYTYMYKLTGVTIDQMMDGYMKVDPSNGSLGN